MKTHSAFFGSFAENPFWYQQFAFRQVRILRGGQPILDFDVADICRIKVTTMKTKNLQGDDSSVASDIFRNHYALAFDLISMQDASQKIHYPGLDGVPLRLDLSFNFPLEHVLEFNVMGERTPLVAVNKFYVL